MQTFLELLNYGLLLVFGALLSLSFSGSLSTHRKKHTIITSSIAVIILLLVVQIISWFFLGYEHTRKIYPLIIHIPLAIFITIHYKCDMILSLVSVLSSYLCCQIPEMFATIARYIFHDPMAYNLAYSITIVPSFYLIRKYAAPYVHRLMALSKRQRILFGIVPLLYYIFDYATTVYTDLLYQGIKALVLFMPMIVSILYFILVVIYYNEMQRRSMVENERLLLSLQMKQSEKELLSYLEAQEKTMLHQHDMQHHFNLITSLLIENNISKAMEYITQTQSDIDNITPIRYCENNTINLILSYFTQKAKSLDIAFSVDVQIPHSICIVESELCTLLSNSLENAFIACAKVMDKDSRTIHMNCKVHKENLLILLENSYIGTIEIVNGLPKSNQPGHGFGIKSMIMIIEKYHGYYSYTSHEGLFTLKIVLPFL